jgi:SAM-dependent methyltransferase
MQNISELARPKDCQYLKSTTQSAPLERLLAAFRSSRLRDHVSQKRVLDFGCGRKAWAARSITNLVKLVHGVDASLGKPEIILDDVLLVQSIGQLPRADYQVIAALAVFEHIPPFDLVDVLHQLAKISTPDAIIVGTVPTPLARPVLELLSFKFGLIDSSQINDHWVYYDDLWLKEIVALTPWKIRSYKLFQMGLNSEFVLVKQS